MAKVYSIDSENLSTLGSVTTRDLDPFGSLTNESLGLFGGADISALYPYYLTLNPESYTASDFASITLNKGISGSDFVTQTDSVFVRSNFRRFFNDIQVILEETSFNVNKKLFNTVIPLSFTTLNVNKPLIDLIGNDDRTYLHSQKLVNDLVENSFDKLESLNFNKGLFEYQYSSDQIQSFDVTKLLEDFANPVDLVAIPDGSTFQLNKTLRNTVDNIVDEISSFNIGKKIENDNAYSLDQTALHSHKPFSDYQQDFNDYSYFTLVKALFDYQIVNDVTNFVIGKSLFDYQSIDDVQRLSLDKRLYDLVDNVEDILQSIDFGKSITDLQLISDTIQSLSVEKALEDFANPVDLVAIPDGSTFQLNKTLRNTILLSDVVQLLLRFNRSFDDINYTDDNDVLSFIKALSDNQFLSDVIQSFVIDKVLQEQSIVDDVTLLDVFKTLTAEFVTPLERKYLTLDKVFADDFSQGVSNTFSALTSNLDLNVGAGNYDFTTIETGFIDFANGQYSLLGTSTILDTLSLSSGKNLFNELYLNDELQSIRLDKLFANNISSFDTNALSFTKAINDYEYALDTIQSINIAKLLEDFANPVDLVSIPDGSTFQLNKTLRNTVDNVTDDFNKIVDYRRKYDDLQNISDAQTLVFNKSLNDFVTVLDELEYTEDIISEQSDFTSILESLDYAFGKNIYDIFTVNDLSTLSFIKFRNDLIDNISDDQALFFSKAINDNGYINDTIQSFSITKLLQDFANPVDLVSIPDGSTFQLNKTLRNTVLPNDLVNFVWDYDRAHSDLQSTFDAQSLNVTKTLTDFVIVLDELSATEDILNNQTDLTSVFELLSYSFGKKLNSATTTSDFNALEFIKSTSDIINGFIDNQTLSFTKAINDYEYALDNIESFSITKLLQDFANPVDLVSIPDGSTFQLNKTLRNTVDNITDDFTRIIDYNRNYADLQSASDKDSLSFTKLLTDFVTVLDEILQGQDSVESQSDFTSVLETSQYSFNKSLKDTQFINDAVSQFVNKSLYDISVLNDSETISFNKGVNDSNTTSDNETRHLSKSLFEYFTPYYYNNLLNDQDYENTSLGNFDFNIGDSSIDYESSTFAFANVIYDELTSVNLAKSIQDFANPVDLIAIPDGSTFQLNKTIHNTILVNDILNRNVSYKRNHIDLQQALDNLENKSLVKPFNEFISFNDVLTSTITYNRSFTDIIFTSDSISTSISGGNGYTSNQGDLSNIEDSGYLFMTDYADITYFAEDYVGESRTFT